MPKRNKKYRRHTNNEARQRIKNGRLKRDIRRIAYIMRVPYGKHYKEKE